MSQARILVVDDEPDFVTYATAVFEDHGARVTAAMNGEEALRLAAETRPDMITLDLEMPEEWGSRLYRKMSKDKDLKDIPVIVISGIDGDHAIRKAVAFIRKPFDADRLLGIVKKTIG